MQVVKPQNLVSSEWLWQFEDGERSINVFDSPNDTWLIFGIFYLDKFDNNPQFKVERLLKQLYGEINSWNRAYPWSEYNGIHLRLDKTSQDVPFILGEICVEDNVMEEESIVVALLQQFSLHCRDSQVFIKVCDTGGDFLLAEACDAIPADYEYPVSINRLWIHDGKFKMIPNEYHKRRGLKPEESLNFLRDNYYKLIVIDGIQKKVSDRITNRYPDGFLNDLVKLPLVIEDTQTMNILVSSPQIISFALKNLINEETDVEEKVSQVHDEYQKEFLVPKRFIDLVSLFLDSKDLKKRHSDIPVYCGRAVTGVLNTLLKNYVIHLGTNEEAISTDNSEMFHLHEFKVASLDAPFTISEDTKSPEDVIDRLHKFFEKDDAKESNNEESLQEEASDDDERARQFFRDENIDIDEDDFFEFFLADALKMKKENMEALRSQKLADESSSSTDDPDSLVGFEDLINDNEAFEGLSPSALGDLLKAMTVDEATDGPLQNILRHASEHQDSE